MATKKITPVERGAFAFGKVLSASQWIILSGSATYFLVELTKLLTQLEIPSYALLIANFVINVLLFGITKYAEGKDK